MAIDQAIYVAKVMHHRTWPKINKFLYNQYYVFLKAGEQWQSPFLLSFNRFNIFSIFFKKQGLRGGTNPYTYACNLLKQHCQNSSWLENIYLVTQPSILGWAFNPVNFWIYVDGSDQIRAVLSHVNNTFKESHQYLAYHDDWQPIEKDQILTAKKVFYVSPFFEVKGQYNFRFSLSKKNLGIWIDYLQGEKTVLHTSLTGKFLPLTNLNLVKLFFKIPAANLKTGFLINWQALKLWLKKIPIIKRSPHKQKEITRCQ